MLTWLSNQATKKLKQASEFKFTTQEPAYKERLVLFAHLDKSTP